MALKPEDETKQVKSRERVRDHGEVFTAPREVNAMLDLVKAETLRIDSRFLEPACGDGNFLIEILRRKLAVVTSGYPPLRGSCADFERHAIETLMSIYGVELLPDNTAACRERLFSRFAQTYRDVCKREMDGGYLCAVRFILSRNILCGDALTLKTPDNKEPLVFSEWTFPNNNDLVQRRDFLLSTLLEDSHYRPGEDLFAFCEAKGEPISPKPFKIFPLLDYRKLGNGEERA